MIPIPPAEEQDTIIETLPLFTIVRGISDVAEPATLTG